MLRAILLGVCLLNLVSWLASYRLLAQEPKGEQDSFARLWLGEFQWTVSPPLLSAHSTRLPASPEHPWIAVKDPSVLRFQDRWHLFCTLRKQQPGNGRIRIGYTSFEKWQNAQDANWSLLELTDEYHGAPQIFYFEPHKLWYLIYQASDASRNLKFGPCYSTNTELNNPAGWTLPQPLYTVKAGAKAGLDFWVICDEAKAHLFFTTLNGKMWRAETALADFPNKGWTDPVVVLSADIFEASHTYKLRHSGKYLTFVEAQFDKSRYFKAYVADRLDGAWTPLAERRDKPFVSTLNVKDQLQSWAESYSHGEIIRAGYNQNLEIDAAKLQVLFQGASREEYTRGSYGDIPWRLGLLNLVEP